MKRLIWCVVFVLLLAIVLTVAVAWTCSLWRPAFEGVGQWAVLDAENGGDTARQSGTRIRGVGWTDGMFFDLNPNDDLITEWRFDNGSMPLGPVTSQARLDTVEAGWPLRCLHAHQSHQRMPSPTFPPLWSHEPWENAITLENASVGATWVDTQVLPLGILPLGMLANIAFWSLPGILIIFLFASIKRVRGRLRRRRMQCAACGYPIGTSDVCSECGASATPLGQLRVPSSLGQS